MMECARREAALKMSSIFSFDWLARVSRWAVWAALAEFVLLRVMIRFGPMLPPSPTVAQAAQGVLFAGTVALNVAAILSILAVIFIAGLTRSNVLRGLLIAAAVLNVTRAAWPHGETWVLDMIFLLYTLVALAAMGTSLMVRHSDPRSGKDSRSLRAETLRACPERSRRVAQGDSQQALLRRVMLMLLVAIYAALAYPVALATAARLGWQWAASASSAASHFVAEGLAVLVALMVYFVYCPTRSKPALTGALSVTALLGGFWFFRPHLASALTQWTVDFASFLPPWIYLLGLAGFLYTAMALARSNNTRLRFAAWGLTLVALGGLRWDYTYYSGLGLVGFLLLAERSLADGGT